jgi:hypothetical protein
VQEMMAGMAGAKVRELDTGHSAMLSKPDELVEMLEEVAK